MNCPYCNSQLIIKAGRRQRLDGSIAQRYKCKACGKKFNERTQIKLAANSVKQEQSNN